MKLAQLLLISLLYALTPFQSLFGQDYWQSTTFLSATTAPSYCILHGGASEVLLVGTLGDGLWRSSDGGLGWQQVHKTDSTEAIYSLERHNNQWWAGTDGGILYSTDSGINWTFVALTTPFQLVDLLYTPEGALYATSTDFWGSELAGSGIFRSNNGGLNWQSVNQGLPNLAVRYLARNSNGRLFAALSGYDNQGQGVSLAYSDNGGALWQPYSVRIRVQNDSFPSPIRAMEWQSLVVGPGDSLWISLHAISSLSGGGSIGLEFMASIAPQLPYWTYPQTVVPSAWWWMQTGLAGIYFTSGGHQLGSWGGNQRGGPWIKSPGSNGYRNIKSGIVPTALGWSYNQFTEDGGGRIYAVQLWEPGVYFSDSIRHSPLALQPAPEWPDLKVGPNPTSDLLQISWENHINQPVFYQISNLQGQQLLNGQWLSQTGFQQEQLDFSDLPTGIYLLQLLQSDRRAHKRIVVAR